MNRVTVWLAGLFAITLAVLAGYLLFSTHGAAPPPFAPTNDEPAAHAPSTPAPLPPSLPTTRPQVAPAPRPPLTAAPPLGTRAAMDLDASVEGDRVPVPKPPLDTKVVQQAIREATTKVKACYHDAFLRDPHLQGRLTIRMTLHASGGRGYFEDPEVQHHPGDEEELDAPDVASCAVAALRGLEFSTQAEGELPITYPFFLMPP